MHLQGTVLLGEDPVGTFSFDEEERVVISLTWTMFGVKELIEYGSEQGMLVGLQLRPEYGSKD